MFTKIEYKAMLKEGRRSITYISLINTVQESIDCHQRNNLKLESR